MDAAAAANGNSIRRSEKKGIRPGFLGGNDKPGGVSKVTDDTGLNARAERRGAAAESLRGAEDAAGGGFYNSGMTGSDLGDAREMEGAPEEYGFYNGGDVAEAKGGLFKGKGNGKKKKVGPIAAIILSIFGFGGVMMGAQTFQPFSLVAQFQEKFNSMQISTNLRSQRMLRWQMSDITDGYVKDPVKVGVFGKKFSLSVTQKKKLKAQGIEYKTDVEVDGKKTKVLQFTDSSGTEHNVTAKNFDQFYAENAEFHQAYNAGSKTWRGQFANWFGSTVINFVTNNRLTRSAFSDFRQRVQDSPGKSSMDVFKEVLNERIAKNTSTGNIKSNQAETEEDADGNVTVKQGETADNTVDPTKMKTEADVKAKLTDISAKFQAGANIGCAIAGFVGGVSMMVVASEMAQIINLAVATLETVDKAKAGDGDASPIHDLATALNSSQVNVNMTLTGEPGEENNGKVGTLEYKTVEGAKKTAMQSEAVGAIYSNGKVNANDPSVASFNPMGGVSKIVSGLTLTSESFMTCTIAKTTAALVGIGVDALEIIGCIAGLIGSTVTFGATSAACGPLLANIGRKIATSVAIGLAIAAVTALITPFILHVFTRDLVSNIGGEDFGNAVVDGANKFMGSSHTSAGGSASTKEKYAQYLVEQQAVIADQAGYERESLSPFDITSKYTFMGSLMTQLMSFTTGSGTLMGTIKSGGTALSNSIAAMSPTATAYSIAEILPDMEKYEETCPYLASIGAVGDAFCNPYVMTDTTTMDDRPDDVSEMMANADNLKDELTSDGNVIVKEGSNLAKYIVYCSNRTSQLGITDYNIANTIGNFATVNTGLSMVDSGANAFIGAIPIIGDTFDIINNASQMANAGYISGETCVAGNSSKFDATPSWDEAKYYQRFIEDQALAESMGLVDKSAATAYYEKYLEEHPLDNSLEGIIARYSGLTTDMVADVFDVIWYVDYIANYHPEERLAFGVSEVEKWLGEQETDINFENENVLASLMTGAPKVVYADVRNRSFAV